MFIDDEELVLMLAEKMPNLLMLNEEKIMANPFTYGEDQVEINLWYLKNGATNHMTGDQENFKELDDKFIENMKVCNK